MLNLFGRILTLEHHRGILSQDNGEDTLSILTKRKVTSSEVHGSSNVEEAKIVT